MEISNAAKLKVVCLGAQKAGKTSLIQQFMYSQFSTEYEGTVGVDFSSKTVFLPSDTTVRMQIWDTAGHSRFTSLTPWYIRESTVAIVIYDITDRQSFGEVAKWVDLVQAEGGTNISVILVGNKTDLADKRVVSEEEGRAVAEELEANFLEASACLHSASQEIFNMAAKLAIKQLEETTLQGWSEIPIEEHRDVPTEARHDDCITYLLGIFGAAVKSTFKMVSSAAEDTKTDDHSTQAAGNLSTSA